MFLKVFLFRYTARGLFKNPHFPENIPHSYFLRVSAPDEHEFGIKKYYDVKLRVYTLIFTIFVNLLFDLEIRYKGFLDIRNTNTALKIV